MTNHLISSENLTQSIQGAKISQADKDFLLSKLPEMNEKARIALFKTLSEIFLLGLEEKRAKERIKKQWVK